MITLEPVAGVHSELAADLLFRTASGRHQIQRLRFERWPVGWVGVSLSVPGSANLLNPGNLRRGRRVWTWEDLEVDVPKLLLIGVTDVRLRLEYDPGGLVGITGPRPLGRARLDVLEVG